VPQPGLYGVGEGVAEVQQRAAAAALQFVVGDDRRLDPAGTVNRKSQRLFVARQQRVEIAPAPVEEGSVQYQAVFDDLGEARDVMALRQRVERIEVGDDAARLVKGADHVLAERVVDAGLAADRRVHLRQQRRRHLGEGDAALVGRRGKARDVADDAAAERHDRGVAARAALQHARADALEGRQVLVLLAVLNLDDNGVKGRRRRQRLQQRIEIQRRDDIVGDDDRAPRRKAFAQISAGAGQQTAPDVHRVAPVGQFHRQRFHSGCGPAARTIASTAASTLPSLWTVQSATSR